MVNKSKSKGSNKNQGGKSSSASKLKKQQKTPKSAQAPPPPPTPSREDGVEAAAPTTKQVLTEVQQNGEINGNNLIIQQVYIIPTHSLVLFFN